MADNSYGEKIIATEGLLAYYPLYVDGKERSGKHVDMTVYGSVDFNGEQGKVSPEGVGSYASKKYDESSDKTDNVLLVERPNGVQCVELWCQFDFVEGEYHGVFCLNAGHTDNGLRFQLAGRLTDEYAFYAQGVSDYIVQNQRRMDSPTHVCAQYEESTNKTTLYFDGEIVSEMHEGNVFDRLTNGGLMGAGNFTVYAADGYIRTYGGTNTSDFAVYNRPLTRAEIWQRAKYGTYDGMILGSEGLLGYYPLDTQDDLSGLHNQGSSIVGAGQGDVNPVSGIAGAKIPVHKNFASDGGTASTIYLPIGTLAIELRAKVYVLKSEETYAVAFTLYDSFPAYTTNRIRVFSYPENDDLDYVSDGGGIIADLASYDEWHHYVIQNEDGAVDFYVDGVLLNSDGNSDLLKMLVLQLGCGTNPEGYYYGGETSNSNVAFYNRPLLPSEIEARVKGGWQVDPIVNLLLSLSSITWSNRETKAQANPQPIYLANHGLGLQTPKYVVKNSPFHTDVMQNQQGDLRKYGYIASTTEISGSPVANKRVLLFEQDSCMLVDETVSDSAGNYRFDSLLIGKKYMITAQYGNKDEHTPPDYSATSVDWQSPTPYEG